MPITIGNWTQWKTNGKWWLKKIVRWFGFILVGELHESQFDVELKSVKRGNNNVSIRGKCINEPAHTMENSQHTSEQAQTT